MNTPINYVSIKSTTMRPNLSNIAVTDIKNCIYPGGHETNKSKYFIHFFTGTGERYEWEFNTLEERDSVYASLPNTPIDARPLVEKVKKA